ncbi:B-cell receptor CD22-like isoform X1 [Genypterus blacodes]|uniref:B-cell receptor CD22-like isoform X1 n=1 Tax=Genypterus blacodes TaxID=154954 RepID=UPI003F76AD92
MAFVNMVTHSVILGLFFLSGALAQGRRCLADLDINSLQRIEALSGSCLQIPCTFRDRSGKKYKFKSTRTTFGVWVKHNLQYNRNIVIYNSSKTVNTPPINIIGDLAQRNCTTIFNRLTTAYNGTYYFRIENGPYRATALCDPLFITVTDSPQRPRIEIPDELKEEQTVTVTCSAPILCPLSPPTLTWNLTHASDKTQHNSTWISIAKIQTTLLLSDKHDGLSIYCFSTHPVNTGKDKTSGAILRLKVSYGPKDTSASISPSNFVSPGSRVNLTCSSRSNPPVSSFTWFMNTTDGAVYVSEGDFYSFSVTTSGIYYCMATNDFGHQTSPEIHVNIEGEPQWKPVLGGIIGIIVLICLVVCVWWLKSSYRSRQQTQSLMGAAANTEEPDSNVGSIHYGEINFSRLEPTQAGESQGHEDTVYAQVKVSQPAHTTTHTESIYAQLKKK